MSRPKVIQDERESMSEKKGDECLYEKEELIVFEEGLFGFEEYRQFLPLPITEGDDAVLSLLSVEDETLSFVLMNPFLLMKEYSPVLPKEIYKKLDVREESELSFYVICVVAEPVQESTVNLKCPIAVNTTNRKAIQVILESEEYQFRHALKELRSEEV